jgi:alkylation response protein AidB-like acyl-CoA dehydrogenase
MDGVLEPTNDPRRQVVRSWLANHPHPSARELAHSGYVVPHWPAPYGLNADPVHQLVIDEELVRAGVKRPTNPTGIGWAGPTILKHGTDAQQERYLWPAIAGEEIWCQLFSEPDAGSDLASLTTRAARDGDHYVVNGSKLWTSGAHKASFGILLARTNPTVPKHQGISYFICPMDLPGIDLRTIIDMTTAHSFNQVFFDDVRIPADLLVGQENDGWRLANVTLGNERVSLSGDGVLWGMGPSTDDLIELLRGGGGITNPVLRDRATRLFIEGRVLELTQRRTLAALMAQRTPGPEASIRKLLSAEHGVRVMNFAKDVVGAHGMLTGSGPAGELPSHRHNAPTQVPFKRDTYRTVEPVWHYGFLFSPALTIGGGTSAVQRNIIAERVLGLPREPVADRGH